MSIRSFRLFVAVLPLALSSCVTVVPSFTRNEPFLEAHRLKPPWKKVVVLPFAGDPVHRRPMAEWFTYLISREGTFAATWPGAAEIELGQRGMTFDRSELPTPAAQEAGRLLAADGVIAGSIKIVSRQTGTAASAGSGEYVPSPNGRSGSVQREIEIEVRVIDVRSGDVVAMAALSGIRPVNDTSATTMMMAEHLTRDLLPVLHALAGGTGAPRQKGTDASARSGI